MKSKVDLLDEKHRKSRSAMFRPSIEKLHAFAVELAAATVSGDLYQAANLLAASPFFQEQARCACCNSHSDDPFDEIAASIGHLRGEAIANARRALQHLPTGATP
ncbi:MAG: hypothetical protein JSR26_04030 [Proteobacteria bacterium]|nr:hypothetical protein [Pseudomonadota bacterium]